MTMRVLGIALLALLIAVGSWAAPPTPYQGSAEGQGFIVTVVDTDIDAAWELVTGAAEWAPMTADTTVRAAYANLSVLDSLRAGNPGVGTLTGIYVGGSTADSTSLNNFLQSRNTGTVGFVSGVFGNAFSSRWNAYATRWADADYKFATEWSVSCWANGRSAGNPGVGKVQTVWSIFHSPQAIRLDYQGKTGFLTGWITDDGSATADSIVVAVDAYDQGWHYARFSCASSVLRLKVDNQTLHTKALSSATSRMTVTDTLTLLGGRGGVNDFRGRLDEVYILEDSTTLASTNVREAYIYGRYVGADTAVVHITGIRKADSTRVVRTFKVPQAAVGADTTKFHAFEWAYLDSSETQPVLLWRTGTTPRQAKLDSIPANMREETVAHALFGYNETPRLNSITFFNYGANAITYELRLYADVMDSVRYDQQYSVLAASYIASGGGPATELFANGGIDLSPGSYIAVMALGGGANSKGGCLIQGQRRWKR